MVDITKEMISDFFKGSSTLEGVTKIEATYHSTRVHIIVKDKIKGKVVKTGVLKPFVWVRQSGIEAMGGIDEKSKKILAGKMQRAGIKIKKLKTNLDGVSVGSRMDNGFKYILTMDTNGSFGGSYNDLLKFFKDNGAEVYPADRDTERHFLALSPSEQFMIQSGIRLFKGTDDYNDVHRLQFDLETEGLDPTINRIFQVGMKDNQGLNNITEVYSQTELEYTKEALAELPEDELNILKRQFEREKDVYERRAIEHFFNTIDKLKPDIIAGYNSANFDWPFIETRCKMLGFDITEVAKTLHPKKQYRVNKRGTLKLGQETEFYTQSIMWGHNILDVSHLVRKAQAINSDIKKWGLKYITEYSDANKPNRVYVDGAKIHKIWADRATRYSFNNENGEYHPLKSGEEVEDGLEKVRGDYIIQRYLQDDLWETEKVDEIYSQATFLLSKMVPLDYIRNATMGTATLWRIIMLTWSYENDLAIPITIPKRKFVGGLARLIEVGYAKGVVKLDYAALYPNIELTHGIFPSIDIMRVMEGLLLYIADTRDEYKALLNKAKQDGDSYMESMYDKKQLPLKILANSFFGSLGATNLFNWGDTDTAEETTARGRIYLRLMVKFFKDKGFRPLVGDSVTKDTPVYIKYDKTGLIDVLPICDLFKEATIDIDGQERDFTTRNYKILTNNGWKKLDYVYRHKTNKLIYDIRTKKGHVRVTEDHSVFQNGKKVLPSKLIIGDKIDMYDIPINNELDTISLDKAWLLGIFIGDGSAVYNDRKQRYFSIKENKYVYHNGKRSEWTLNNLNHDYLKRAKNIIKDEYSIDVPIKDYLESSSTYKLKTHYAEFSKEFANSCYTSYREKCIPLEILNSTKEIKLAFLDGFVCADGNGSNIINNQSFYQKSITNIGGLAYLLNSVDLQYNIGLKKYHYDKGLCGLTLNTPTKLDTSSDGVILWKKEFSYNDYVYDVSTEDGSFIGGVGGVSCSNTDGFNFAYPDDVEKYHYDGKGTHRMVKKGERYQGVAACVAEFNELYMIGRMGLDIDEYCRATINFKRKNYADIIIKPKGGEKIKFVGNTIKSKGLPIYIEEFLEKGVLHLLEDEGDQFIDLYNKWVDDIFNYRIPLMKIASKSRVKETVKHYQDHSSDLTKAGNIKAKKAHMELVIQHGLSVNLGDTIYFINIGSTKSAGNVVNKKHKDGTTEVIFNCELIPAQQMEENPNLTNDSYNVAKYVANFNKRVASLLVVFNPEVRNRILRTTKKDRKTKEIVLDEKNTFTREETKLVAGYPLEAKHQDDLEINMMTFDDRELIFWDSVDVLPNNLIDLGIDDETWKQMLIDAKERKRIEDIELFKKEQSDFDIAIYKLEDGDLLDFKISIGNDKKREAFFKYLEIKFPFLYLDFTDEGIEFISILHKKSLGGLIDLFKYEELAKLRKRFYTTLHPNSKKNKWKAWEEYYEKLRPEDFEKEE